MSRKRQKLKLLLSVIARADLKLKIQLSEYENYAWNLFNTCERYNTLPASGGVEEQSWDYLFIFSEIKSELNKPKKTKGK